MIRYVTLSLAALFGAALSATAQDGLEAGQEIYTSYCASCHGLEGRGDGNMAPILSILPTDLTRLSEMAGGAFPREAVARQIDGRDPFLAHGGVMPVYGAFFDSDPPPPSVVIELDSGQRMLTPEPIAQLLAYLESIQE